MRKVLLVGCFLAFAAGGGALLLLMPAGNGSAVSAARTVDAPAVKARRAASGASANGDDARARPLAGAPEPGSAGDGERSERIELDFKLDPRLTAGLHMGERWVSPPTHSGRGEAGRVRVGARARVLDESGRRSPAALAWLASEPDMVELSRDEGDEVTITIWRAGRSTVTVSSAAALRTLTVEAVEQAGALRFVVRQ